MVTDYCDADSDFGDADETLSDTDSVTDQETSSEVGLAKTSLDVLSLSSATPRTESVTSSTSDLGSEIDDGSEMDVLFEDCSDTSSGAYSSHRRVSVGADVR